MSYNITKNQSNINMLTLDNKWVKSLSNFLKNMKSSDNGRVQKMFSDVYNNTNDKNLKEIIENTILKKATKINISDKTYDISTDLKNTFNINNSQLNKLIINSSLRLPIYLSIFNTINKIEITDKPLAIRQFTNQIKNKKDFVGVFSGKIKNVDNVKFNFNIDNIKTSFQITFTFNVLFSAEKMNEERQKLIIVNDENFTNLKNFDYTVDKYFENIKNDYINSGALDIKVTNININSVFLKKTQDIKKMIMRKSDPLNIKNLFNNIIDISNGNCVKTYLTKLWSKLGNKTIDLLKTPDDIYNLCKSKNIKTICYDIFGKVINAYYPNKLNKSYKSLIYICYDNHIYPFKNNYLEKNKISNYEIKIVDDIDIEINNFLNNGIIPANIKLNKDNKIVSFTNANYKYIYNDEYLTCLDILKVFGLNDKIYDTIRISNIGAIIDKLYIKSNINSFMPFDYTKNPFIYHNNKINFNNNEITTIDKNKCYSNALFNLKYVIKTDIKYNNYYDYVILNKDLSLIDEYLYICEPKESTILLPNKDFYTGEYLKYCKNEGLKFEIYNTLETTKDNNYYKEFINDLYNKLNYDIKINDQKINCAKYIINIMIGKFNQPIKTQLYKKNINIIRTDNIDYYDGYQFAINDSFNIIYETYEDVKYINNKIPIDIQIKDESRKILYQKMKELNIKNDDIIQIKTDSITFKGINKNINNINNLFIGWKYEEYNKITAIQKMITKDINLNNIIPCLNTTLYDCYAGAGKSYHITKTYKNENDYIILTPKHNANKDYKREKLNCDVIQKYEFSNTIPNENTIVIDEIGQIGYKGWDIIVKCALIGKRIRLYGDFKQLEPIDGHIYNSNIWRKYFYYNIKIINTNYRNNFTIDYYNKIINGEINEKEILKYNNKNSDNIIVYRNITRIKYNKLICQKKNIKNIFDIGNKIICITNELGFKNIYNGFTFIIKKQEFDYVITEDDFKISFEELEKNFDYGWALTIHKIQGETLDNYYFPKDDLYFCKNPKVIYTIISRLKCVLSDDTLARNEKYNYLWE